MVRRASVRADALSFHVENHSQPRGGSDWRSQGRTGQRSSRPARTSVAARSQDSPFDRIPTAKRRCTRPKSSRTTNGELGSPDSSRRRRRPIRRPRKPSRSPIPRLRSRGGESPDAYARSRWRPRRAQPPGTVPWRSGCRHSNRAVGAVPSVEAIARDMRGFSARWGESSCDA
jgi:hypothetical protein